MRLMRRETGLRKNMDAPAFPDTSCRFPAGEELMSTLRLKESGSCPGEGGEREMHAPPVNLYFINKTGIFRNYLWESGLSPTGNPVLSLLTACLGRWLSTGPRTLIPTHLSEACMLTGWREMVVRRH